MHSPPSQRAIHPEAEIARILLELATEAGDADGLRAWAQRSEVELERVVAIEPLTYVRLTGRDTEGEPVVLMLLDGAWERIF